MFIVPRLSFLPFLLCLFLLCSSSSIAEDCKEGLQSFKSGVNAKKKSDEIAFYEKALSLCPSLTEASYNLGVVKENDGELAKALELFQTAFNQKNSERYLSALSRIRLDLTRYEEVVTSITSWLDVNQNQDRGKATAELHLLRGAAYMGVNDIEKAKKDFEVAVKLDPDSASAHQNLGVVNERQGIVSTAYEEYEKALILEPGKKESLYGKAVLLFKRSSFPESIEALESLTSQHEDFASAWNLLGQCYLETGDLDRAEVSLRKSLSVNPTYVKTRESLAQLLLKKQQPSLALDVLKGIPESEKDRSASVLTLVGWAQGDLGKLDEAKITLTKAVKLDSGDPRAAHNLGVVLERLGDKGGALKAFKKALELDPSLEETSKSVSRLE